MAYQTGTATNYVDLMDKILAFAVSGGGWTDLGPAADQADGSWVKGPGLSATENIYAGLFPYVDEDTDTHGIWMRGAQGFIGSLAFANQPGVSPAVFTPAWNTSMPYWIVANGQRVIAVWKVSTTYHAIHFGKIFPYATPSEYGYPVYIGGQGPDVRRWSYQSQNVRHFVDPGYQSAWFCFPDGAWQDISNFLDSGGSEATSGASRYVWPYLGANDKSGGNYTRIYLLGLRKNLDASYTMLPHIIHSNSPSKAAWGEIDGTYYCSGEDNAAENVITINAQDYLVIQNVYRTSRHHYWALKLA